MDKNGIQVSIVTNKHNNFTEYKHNNNTYIESREGSEYGIKVTNFNSYRVEALITVDGLDIIKGKPTSFDTRGYVLKAYESVIFEGYRVSDTNIRRFVFGRKGKDTYVNKVQEDSSNIGVIGVAVFKEFRDLTDHWDNILVLGNSSNSSKPELFKSGVSTTSGSTSDFRTRGLNFNASYNSTQSDHGTNMGSSKKSHISNTFFTRDETYPVTTFAFQYRSKKILKSMGIVIHSNYQDSLPNPFPLEENYCKEV